jgi:hypothetical protein
MKGFVDDLEKGTRLDSSWQGARRRRSKISDGAPHHRRARGAIRCDVLPFIDPARDTR